MTFNFKRQAPWKMQNFWDIFGVNEMVNKKVSRSVSCPLPSCARAMGWVTERPKKVPGNGKRDI